MSVPDDLRRIVAWQQSLPTCRLGAQVGVELPTGRHVGEAANGRIVGRPALFNPLPVPEAPVTDFKHEADVIPSMHYAIRHARADDLVGLPVLEHAASQMFLHSAYPEIAGEHPTTVDEFRHWLERGSLVVAVDACDGPVAYAIAHELDGDAYVHEIDVHPNHGRRGVGRRLIDHVRACGAMRGFHRVVLSTFRDVPWNAPYYARLGFRELLADQVGSKLAEVRQKERAAGLKVARRVFMALPIARPSERLQRNEGARCSR